MTSNDNGLLPSGHDLGHALEQDGLSENSSVQDVADRTVGRFVHLGEVELLDTLLVRGDGRTLDSNVVLEDRLCSIDGHLIACL